MKTYATIAALIALAPLLGGCNDEDVATPQNDVHVSQKGRMFNPGDLTVVKGTRVHFVNDDQGIRHHAFTDDAGFAFDSGDQEPGADTPVVFSKSGTFTVMCGIHPKMKMKVTVR